MSLWGGERKTAAVFLWVSLFFVLSGLLLYLFFAAPPAPPPHSHPVMTEAGSGGIRSVQKEKGDDDIDYSSQDYRAGW